MKNISLFLTDCYGGRGGIAQYNRNLIESLTSINNLKEITIFQRKIVYKPEKVPKKVNLVSNISNSRINYILKTIYHTMFGKKYDVIFCCHIHLLPFSWIMSLKNKCPLVLIIFGEEAWKPTKYKISNYFCKKIDYLCTIRHHTAKKFFDWTKIKNKTYIYLPNCIDPKKYNSKIKNKKIVEKYKLKNKKIIISCARLDKEDRFKGVDETIQSLGKISKNFPNIFYVIIGDGNDKKRLEIKAKSLKVDHLCLFTGKLDEKTKNDLYKIGHVMAMPGSRKTFDRYPYRFVNLEGLASGMHVLCSELKYKSDLEDKNIRMLTQVNPNNQKQIVKKFNSLLIKKKKISPYLKNFYFKNFKKRVEDIYSKLTNK